MSMEIGMPNSFFADIQDVRAVSYHLFGVQQGGVKLLVSAPVGERIRRYVQDSHNISMSLCVKCFVPNDHN